MLTINGEKVHYTRENRSLSPNVAARGMAPVSSETSVFDGKEIKTFLTGEPMIYLRDGIGTVRPGTAHPRLWDIGFQPLLLTYRGLDARYCHSPLPGLKLLPQREKFNGRDCMVLAEQFDDEQVSRSIWVDRERSFSIVRIVARIGKNRTTGSTSPTFKMHRAIGARISRSAPRRTFLARTRGWQRCKGLISTPRLLPRPLTSSIPTAPRCWGSLDSSVVGIMPLSRPRNQGNVS